MATKQEYAKERCKDKWKPKYVFTDAEITDYLESCRKELDQTRSGCYTCDLAYRVGTGMGCPLADAIRAEYDLPLGDESRGLSTYDMMMAFTKHLTIDSLYSDLVKVKEATNKEVPHETNEENIS